MNLFVASIDKKKYNMSVSYIQTQIESTLSILPSIIKPRIRIRCCFNSTKRGYLEIFIYNKTKEIVLKQIFMTNDQIEFDSMVSDLHLYRYLQPM